MGRAAAMAPAAPVAGLAAMAVEVAVPVEEPAAVAVEVAVPVEEPAVLVVEVAVPVEEPVAVAVEVAVPVEAPAVLVVEVAAGPAVREQQPIVSIPRFTPVRILCTWTTFTPGLSRVLRCTTTRVLPMLFLKVTPQLSGRGRRSRTRQAKRRPRNPAATAGWRGRIS